jgi:hypothetical protein
MLQQRVQSGGRVGGEWHHQTVKNGRASGDHQLKVRVLREGKWRPLRHLLAKTRLQRTAPAYQRGLEPLDTALHKNGTCMPASSALFFTALAVATGLRRSTT